MLPSISFEAESETDHAGDETSEFGSMITKKQGRAILHGVTAPLNADVISLVKLAAFADLFIYICVTVDD